MAMTFIELGSILRAEREKQGLSIDDVANRLKISVRVLRALECADDDSLPHSVYVRGFVISYGKLLGLDTEELLLVEELYDASEDPSNNETGYIDRRNPISASRIIFIIFLCLCLAVGAFMWLNRDADLFSKIKKDHLTTAQPAPAMPATNEEKKIAKNAETSSQSNTEEVTQKSSKVEDNTQNNNTVNAQAEQVEQNKDIEKKTKSTNIVAEQNKQEATQSTPEVETKPTPELEARPTDATQAEDKKKNNTSEEASQVLDGPHKVIITAIAECWVHSNADDGDTRQFSLQAGDTFALTFTDSLSLKLGNAGGVRIRYNGSETPVPGRDGEVKTLTFPPRQ